MARDDLPPRPRLEPVPEHLWEPLRLRLVRYSFLASAGASSGALASLCGSAAGMVFPDQKVAIAVVWAVLLGLCVVCCLVGIGGGMRSLGRMRALMIEYHGIDPDKGPPPCSSQSSSS